MDGKDDFLDSDGDVEEVEFFDYTPPKPKDNDFNRQIIKLVQEYPILYDRSHKYFFQRKTNHKAWNDIGKRLGRSGVQCAKAYKSLYMKFGIHHVMLNDRQYENIGYPKKDFPYYQDMMFLKGNFCLVKAKKRAKQIAKYDMRHLDAARREEIDMRMIQKKMGWNTSKKAMKKARLAKKEAMKKSANPPPPTKPNLSIVPTPGPSSTRSPISLALSKNHDFSEDLSLDNFHDHWPQAQPEAPKVVTPPKPKGPPLKADEVDFFFNSVSQQVVRARLSPRNFSDLKSSILTALSGKLPNINKNIR